MSGIETQPTTEVEGVGVDISTMNQTQQIAHTAANLAKTTEEAVIAVRDVEYMD